MLMLTQFSHAGFWLTRLFFWDVQPDGLMRSEYSLAVFVWWYKGSLCRYFLTLVFLRPIAQGRFRSVFFKDNHNYLYTQVSNYCCATPIIRSRQLPEHVPVTSPRFLWQVALRIKRLTHDRHLYALLLIYRLVLSPLFCVALSFLPLPI